MYKRQGTYTLVEAYPPSGYAPQERTYPVVVDYYGRVTVDGVPQERFILPNNRIPDAFGSFTVVKTDMKDGTPLADAVFGLFSGEDVYKRQR